MRPFESWSIRIRHHPWLDGAHWLWDGIRPYYDKALELLTRGVIERKINGSDQIFLTTKFRHVEEMYEPVVWKHLMAEVREGDVVADVGAYIGLYTVALAKRVGTSGRIVAFEPNLATFKELEHHVDLNGVRERVDLIPAAVGAHEGQILFEAGRASESCVTSGPGTLV